MKLVLVLSLFVAFARASGPPTPVVIGATGKLRFCQDVTDGNDERATAFVDKAITSQCGDGGSDEACENLKKDKAAGLDAVAMSLGCRTEAVVVEAGQQFCQDVTTGKNKRARAFVDLAIAFQCGDDGSDEACGNLKKDKAAGLDAVAMSLGCGTEAVIAAERRQFCQAVTTGKNKKAFHIKKAFQCGEGGSSEDCEKLKKSSVLDVVKALGCGTKAELKAERITFCRDVRNCRADSAEAFVKKVQDFLCEELGIGIGFMGKRANCETLKLKADSGLNTVAWYFGCNKACWKQWSKRKGRGKKRW